MLEVREIPLTQIKVKNRARIDKGDIVGLADSIKEHGLLQPVTIDQHMNLIAGERRFLAHQHLKLQVIPAIQRHIDGIINAAEIELVENIQRKDLHWAERSNLEKRIYDMKCKADPKWSMSQQGSFMNTSKTGVVRRIQLAEAMELIPELAEYKTEDEAFKEYKRLEEGIIVDAMLKRVPPHVARAMEKAGEHYRIGDAFEGMAATPDESVQFAEVDPPYGVKLDKRKGRNKDQRLMDSYSEWDDYLPLFSKTLDGVYRILKPNSFAVIWYGMSWHTDVMKAIKHAGFTIPDIPAIWSKGDAGQTASPDTTLGSCYEPFFLARKGSPILAKPGRSNVFNFPKLASTTKDHPTQKPLILMKEIMATCLLPGCTILVPFLGSGVTLRAAYKLGHTGFGWDLSEEYRKAFLKRVADDHKELEEQEDEDEGEEE